MTAGAEATRAARLTRFIKDEAGKLGFDLCRVTTPEAIPEAESRLSAFLAAGHHGTMEWMEETAERRADPRSLWPEVQSVVLFGMNYGPDRDPRYLQDLTDKAHISVYARNRDYHDVIKGRLKEIATKFAARSKADVKVFVDTAPVMEKPLAAAAGLGWQGKHTNLVSRAHGSWLFLGAIYTTLVLASDGPSGGSCGSCDACQTACPTDAFPAPYRIDARRCVSYLTIENKGPIPHAFREAIGNRIYGCDDCLAVCPWNKFAVAAQANLAFHPRAELTVPYLADLLALDDASFRAVFAGSPIKRIGRDRMMRNCLIAAGNSGSARLVPPVRALLDDPTPVVRGAAIWALARLDPPRWQAERADRAAQEADPQVRAEWDGLDSPAPDS